ncbi:hypothetical protein JAAARDRAFT_188716 [Jaapia argillacea MUCL 33604]|uniref:Uncharacterized protein n=1 Tax=Jaapia argillacea MUCL 33604 TaxID=933084 RepID=A0A067QKE5_9AGAM|nr:hypothetical protein JAAARDRAFT_188716 [Jaapia argillacea MUCL 33604]
MHGTEAPTEITQPSAMVNRKNKSRLYLIFHHQPQTGPMEEGIKFHTTVNVAPKKPAPPIDQSWRFHLTHAMRRGVPTLQYQGEQVVNSEATMVAAVLVCKLDPGITGIGLSMLLREVPIFPLGDGSEAGQWAKDALRLLVERDVIPPLRVNIDDIWEHGHRFAESVQRKAGRTIHTCDIYGTEIKSEIPRTSS